MTPRRLTRKRYVAYLAIGLALTGIQLLMMPRLLKPTEFGFAVIGISVTQGLLQFGDLGISGLCIDSRRSAAEQLVLRTQGRTMLITTSLVVALVALVWSLVTEPSTVAQSVGLGALAAAAIAGTRFKAMEHVAGGDEIGAATDNLLWSNAPKVGLLIPLFVFDKAVPILAVSAVVTLCVGLWSWNSAKGLDFRGLVRVSEYLAPLVAIGSAFGVAWLDTYFVALGKGVAAAGMYQLVYRILGVATYLYLPWGSVISTRVNAGTRRPLTSATEAALILTIGCVAMTAAGLAYIAPTVFPSYAIPLTLLPLLAVFYTISAISYCFGSALVAYGRLHIVGIANALGLGVAVVGHSIITLRVGPVGAASVSLVAISSTAAVQIIDYVWMVRRIQVDPEASVRSAAI